ncbi:hypothetical protein D3C87_1202490 [compost metagenome]
MIAEKKQRIFHHPGLDLNSPIYRFVSWRWVEDLLIGKNLTLVRPESWDDPFEMINRPIQVRVTDKNQGYSSKVLDQHNFEVFSQSWTTKDMADTMLRAYSKLASTAAAFSAPPLEFEPEQHALEAIQISTTIGKLLGALEYGLENLAEFESAYITQVDYMSEEELANRVVSTYANGPDTGKDPACVVSLLSIKRDNYEAENEVRPIVLLNERAKELDYLRVKTDPEILIDSITIDPRISSFKVKASGPNDYVQRIELLKKWGFASKIRQSHLYAVSPIFESVLDLDSPDLNLSAEAKARWRELHEINKVTQ